MPKTKKKTNQKKRTKKGVGGKFDNRYFGRLKKK